MAGHFGTPVIMLSGDQAAANELHEIVPDAELAVVKEGIGRYTCISFSAAAARDAIREAARRSVSKIGSIKPYTVSGRSRCRWSTRPVIRFPWMRVCARRRGPGRPHDSLSREGHPGSLESVSLAVTTTDAAGAGRVRQGMRTFQKFGQVSRNPPADARGFNSGLDGTRGGTAVSAAT